MDDNQNPTSAPMPNDMPIQTPAPMPTSTPMPDEQEKGAMPIVPEQGVN